jgi:hypothetical protein
MTAPLSALSHRTVVNIGMRLRAALDAPLRTRVALAPPRPRLRRICVSETVAEVARAVVCELCDTQ